MNTKQTLEECPTLQVQPTERLRPTLSTPDLLTMSLKTEKTSKDSKFKQHSIHVIKATNINSKIKTTQITASFLSQEIDHHYISVIVRTYIDVMHSTVPSPDPNHHL